MLHINLCFVRTATAENEEFVNQSVLQYPLIALLSLLLYMTLVCVYNIPTAKIMGWFSRTTQSLYQSLPIAFG